MKLVELLPEIDDIDGTPMKTSYKIVFGSKKDTEEEPSASDKWDIVIRIDIKSINVNRGFQQKIR